MSTSKPASKSAVPAPLFVDVFDLCAWLLGRLDAHPGALAAALNTGALRLLELVVLALHDRDRARNIAAADAQLLVLRTYLRLAEPTRLLTQDQMLHALERADGIGRQLGGWIKAQPSN